MYCAMFPRLGELASPVGGGQEWGYYHTTNLILAKPCEP